MICKKCGANMPDGSNVCSVCGASMTASPFMQAADLDGFESGSVSTPERKREDGQKSQPEVRFNMGGSPKSATVETSAPEQYCTNCGAPMEAGAQFCTGCGASVAGVKANKGSKVEERVNEVTTKVWDTVNGAVKGKSKKQLFIIGGAIAALVLVVGIALFALLGGRSAEATVEKYIDATYSVDVKTMMKLFPKDVMRVQGYDAAADYEIVYQFLS